jgi:hypothetical protein
MFSAGLIAAGFLLIVSAAIRNDGCRTHDCQEALNWKQNLLDSPGFLQAEVYPAGH